MLFRSSGLFQYLVTEKLRDPAFRASYSNGRYARNVFEEMLKAQSRRLTQINIQAASNETMNELLLDDLQALVNSGDFARLH